MVYDVNVKRVNKVLKISRKYMNWTIRSVLEGFLTKESYESLKRELLKVIDEKEDSVYFYLIDTSRRPHKIVLGEVRTDFKFIR
jgi:CRISPR-associated protein Cas2